MPIPVKRNSEIEKSAGEFQLDYSWLSGHMPAVPSTKKMVLASDKDAGLLMELWLESDKIATDKIKQRKESKISSSDIMRLRTRGLLDAEGDNFKLTSSGKTIIATMALGENNRFLKNQKSKSYTEIMASMDKRNKAGYRGPKFASSDLINLKKTGTTMSEAEDAFYEHKVPCKYCGEQTDMIATKICSRCYALKMTIEGQPATAERILAEFKAGKKTV